MIASLQQMKSKVSVWIEYSNEFILMQKWNCLLVVHQVTMVTLMRLAAPVKLAAVAGTSTWVTRTRVTGLRASVSYVNTSQPGTTVNTVRTGSMEMPSRLRTVSVSVKLFKSRSCCYPINWWVLFKRLSRCVVWKPYFLISLKTSAWMTE